MIPDWTTNCVYFSKLLPERYPTLWTPLERILRSHRIPVTLIGGTRDIWARDYCPVQVGPKHFVKFRYHPDYLNGYEHLMTANTVCRQFEDLGICRRSNIVLDGGNVVASQNKVILTEKVFRENSRCTRSKLRTRLAELFLVDSCILIPKEPGDAIGHSDGIVRFIDDDVVVVNDYSKVDSDYGKQLNRALARAGLQIRALPHFREDRIEDGIPSAAGNYVNFLRVGNLVMVPTYKNRRDDWACSVLEQLCPHMTVVPLPCTDLARAGGVLNCITWTARTTK